MTATQAFAELLLGLGLVVDVGEAQSPAPVIVTNRFPDDIDHAFVVLPYAWKRDTVQNVNEEIANEQERSRFQLFYRSPDDYDTMEQRFCSILDQVRLALPYTTASSQRRLAALYIINGPIRYIVDRHKRIVYLANVQLVHRALS